MVSVALLSAEEKSPEAWLVAAEAFKTQEVPKLFESYAQSVPKLFLLQLDANFRHRVSLDEKKARALSDMQQKNVRLLRERATLIHQRDVSVLSIIDKSEREKKIEKLNADIQKKEQEIERLRTELQSFAEAKNDDTHRADEEVLPVQLWKGGNTLFPATANTLLAETLKKEKVQALISGEVKDVGGYMLIRVYLKTGVYGVPDIECSNAGKYTDVTTVVEGLALQLQKHIQNTQSATLILDIKPEDAQIYLNGEILNYTKEGVAIAAGIHSVSIEARNFASAHTSIHVEEGKKYRLKATLKPSDTVDLSFGLSNPFDELFYKGRSKGAAPVVVGLEKKETLIEVEKNGIKTMLLFSPEMLDKINDEENLMASFKTNTQPLQKRIERQRSVLYWSLGAFYVSLPIFMILQAKTQTLAQGINSGTIPRTDKNVKRFYDLRISTYVFEGVAIGLGLNYFIQLIRYLVIADKSIPQGIDVQPQPQVQAPAEPEQNNNED